MSAHQAVFSLMMTLAAARTFAAPTPELTDAVVLGRRGAVTSGVLGAPSVRHNPALLARLFGLHAAAGGGAWAGEPLTLGLSPHVYGGYGTGRFGWALGLGAARSDLGSSADAELGFGHRIADTLSWGISGGLRLQTAEPGPANALQPLGSIGLSWAPSERLRLGLLARLPGTLRAGAGLFLPGWRGFIELARLGGGALTSTVALEKDLSDIWVLRAGVRALGGRRVAFTPGGSIGLGRDFGPVAIDAAYALDVELGDGGKPLHQVALTVRFAAPPGVASTRADTSSPREAGERPNDVGP